MANPYARLTQDCPHCTEARLHLAAICEHLGEAYGLDLVLDGKPSRSAEIACKACAGTGVVLTPEGEQFLNTVKPLLKGAGELTPKDLAKAEKKQAPQPAERKEMVK